MAQSSQRFRDWFDYEEDVYGNRKLRQDTPEDIKKEYEEYKNKKRQAFKKEGIIY